MTEAQAMRLTAIEINNNSWRELSTRRTLSEAKRTALTHVRTIFPDSIGRKVTFEKIEGYEDQMRIFYADINGNLVPVPMRLRHFEIKVGDLVNIRLHTLADEPDCHKASKNPKENQFPCSHSHHQVGRVLRIYRKDGCGWVADIDWFQASHRYAGDKELPYGVSSIFLWLLRPVNPFLREYEILEGVQSDLYQYHCGGYVEGQEERCTKPVVRIFYRWSDEAPWRKDENAFGGPRPTYHLDGWRHMDGTGPWDHCSISPIPLCQDCGYEGGKHCHKCHKGESLKTTQEAYGDRTVCLNPECDYEFFYDIGD